MLQDVWEGLGRALGLGVETEQLGAGQMGLRALVIFAVGLAIVRLGDKRLFGKGTAFDLVVAIMIGSVMSRAITGSGPMLATWLAGLVLVGMHWLLALLASRGWFGPLIKGNPVLLVKDGQLRRGAMRQSHVTRMDLEQALRAEGREPDPSTVRLAYLERDGSISVVPCKDGPRVLEVSVADGGQTVRIAVE